MSKFASGWLIAGILIINAASIRFVWGEEKAASGVSDEKPAPVVSQEQPMSFWMEKKLEYSKKILEALTSGKFADIESNAEQMRLLGKIEGFVRRRNPSYTSHLQSFDLATREITRQARTKSIEGATLAFHELTTSCVRCHQGLRELASEADSTSGKSDSKPND